MRWPYRKIAQILLPFGFVLCACIPGWSQTRQFQFEQYPAKVYEGPIKVPARLHKDKDGWKDEDGRGIALPSVGFAGEYYLPVQSCGTGCRFYSLVNLRTGVGIPEISMFDSGDPLPRTKNGHPYLTELFYRPNSRLLIAEYHLDFDNPHKTETCRQRYFVFEDRKIRPISKTFPFCTEDQEK